MTNYLKNVWRNLYSHLLFFYAGAFIFIQLDIWYWTPKEGISPATFTAGASTITLLLALLALTKVNKWFDDKIKDKRFEKAHYFFEKMTEMYVAVSKLNASVSSLPITRDLMKTSLFSEGLKVVKESRQEAMDLIIEVAAIAKQFPAMDIKFHHTKALDKYITRCALLCKETFTMCAFLENREFPEIGRITGESERKFDKIVQDSKFNIIKSFPSCNYIGEGFIKIKFESMFELLND